ncbi:MAG: hypothetical protein KGY99_07760 [Phycisphaerae bacterium]|nr:hypothetical protein [Phycisphaerae bacterium]
MHNGYQSHASTHPALGRKSVAWLVLATLVVLTLHQAGCQTEQEKAPEADEPDQTDASLSGTWLGPTISKRIGGTINDKPIATKWQLLLRFTDKTIASGKIFRGLNADRKLVEMTRQMGGRRGKLRLPSKGERVYDPTREYEVLERNGKQMTLKMHLPQDESKLINVRRDGADLLVEGSRYSREGG